MPRKYNSSRIQTRIRARKANFDVDHTSERDDGVGDRGGWRRVSSRAARFGDTHATSCVIANTVLKGPNVLTNRSMDHVSDLRGIRLCFNGVLTSTSRVGEAMILVTHFVKKITQRGLQTGNAPGLVNGMARLGPMSSNKPIHATVKIDIVETMFTQKLIHPGVVPIGAAPRQLDQDPRTDVDGVLSNDEKRVP